MMHVVLRGRIDSCECPIQQSLFVHTFVIIHVNVEGWQMFIFFTKWVRERIGVKQQLYIWKLCVKGEIELLFIGPICELHPKLVVQRRLV